MKIVLINYSFIEYNLVNFVQMLFLCSKHYYLVLKIRWYQMFKVGKNILKKSNVILHFMKENRIFIVIKIDITKQTSEEVQNKTNLPWFIYSCDMRFGKRRKLVVTWTIGISFLWFLLTPQRFSSIGEY